MKAVDVFVDKFADIIIKRMDSVNPADWQKPWICSNAMSIPRNISGRAYNRYNMLLLMFMSQLKGYKTNYWLTYNQASTLRVKVLQGQEATPVLIFKPFAVNKHTNERISEEDYQALPFDQKADYDHRYYASYYNVFNVDQTNMQDVNPLLYNKCLPAKTQTNEITSTNEVLDAMLSSDSWCCKIIEMISSEAYYDPLQDVIVVPERTQFPDTNEFYSTLLHEMAHSTAPDGRLNRNRDNYAREELVGELSSVVNGALLGVSSLPSKNNIRYIKGWQERISSDKNFLKSTIFDVGRVVNFTEERLGLSFKNTIGKDLTQEYKQDKTIKL